MAYNKNPELIDKEIVEEAKKMGAALLADGMKDMGIEMEGCMCPEMMPAGDPYVHMAGTALTVETDDGDNFPIHVATYSGGEGYVMVIDGKGCHHRAYLGGLIASAAQAIGFEGIVCDGYVRDRDDCAAIGFPVYARGLLQRGPIKKNRGNINIPVRCGGVTVTPGDLVVGDCDGVTVVPKDKIGEVMEKARAKGAYEENRVKTIQAYREAKAKGEPLPQLAPKWVLDMLEE